MDENTKKSQAAMVARAENVIKTAAVEFGHNLTNRVHELEQAIINNNPENVIRMAYDLESEAAIFGWSRVTRISKWLTKIFTGEFDQKPKAEEISKALNALKIMVSDPDNPDEDRDVELVRKLYPILSRVGAYF